jgi:hypothetical protein
MSVWDVTERSDCASSVSRVITNRSEVNRFLVNSFRVNTKEFVIICIVSFFKSAVRVWSNWYEQLKVANSAFQSAGWQRRVV